MSVRVLNQMKEGHTLDNTAFSMDRWSQVETADSNTNVMPIFGRKHKVGKGCWCSPTIYRKSDASGSLVLHNVEM